MLIWRAVGEMKGAHLREAEATGTEGPIAFTPEQLLSRPDRVPSCGVFSVPKTTPVFPCGRSRGERLRTPWSTQHGSVAWDHCRLSDSETSDHNFPFRDHTQNEQGVECLRDERIKHSKRG